MAPISILRDFVKIVSASLAQRKVQFRVEINCICKAVIYLYTELITCKYLSSNMFKGLG